MLRKMLCSTAALALLVAGAAAIDKDAKPDKDKDSKVNKDDKEMKATITKVDKKNKSITLKWKDKNGKDVEKTFMLDEDIRYLDSTGKVAAIDVFNSGDDVLIIEREGKLKHMKKHDKGTTEKDKKTTDKKDK